MIFKFFNPRPDTLDEGKALYRRLAAQYHPLTMAAAPKQCSRLTPSGTP